MPILNYTTKISVDKTVGEVQKKLAEAGAEQILVQYGNKIPIALSFKINTRFGVMAIQLPTRMRGVLKRLEANKRVPRNLKTGEQAARVAWRILKVWVEAQLAFVESEMVELQEVFLPYVQSPQTGQTFYEAIEEKKFKGMLAAPRD